MGTPITGQERIKLELSIEDITFLISGCRDSADAAEGRRLEAVLHEHRAEFVEFEAGIRDHNNQLADMLEQEMLSQIGGE